jgi:hypothetical protein
LQEKGFEKFGYGAKKQFENQIMPREFHEFTGSNAGKLLTLAFHLFPAVVGEMQDVAFDMFWTALV